MPDSVSEIATKRPTNNIIKARDYRQLNKYQTIEMDNDQEEEPPIPPRPAEETQAEREARDARDEERFERLGPLKRYSSVVRSPYLKEFTLLRDDDLRCLPTLKGVGEEDDIGFSHVCKHCHKAITLKWKKKLSEILGGSYHTVAAQRHLEKCVEGGKDAIAVTTGVKEESVALKRARKVEVIKNAHLQAGYSELKKQKRLPLLAAGQQTLPKATYEMKALCAQAHWFIYSPGNPSLATLVAAPSCIARPNKSSNCLPIISTVTSLARAVTSSAVLVVTFLNDKATR